MEKAELIRERLIESRDKLGITKQEAAKRMNMSQPAYLRYESGDRLPSIHIIQTMADVLGTSAEYLTGKVDDDEPNCFIIKSDLEPELFWMIEEYKKLSLDNKNRFLEYIEKLKN